MTNPLMTTVECISRLRSVASSIEAITQDDYHDDACELFDLGDVEALIAGAQAIERWEALKVALLADIEVLCAKDVTVQRLAFNGVVRKMADLERGEQ